MGEVPYDMSMSPSTTIEVFTKEGKAFLSLGGKAISDRKGLHKMRWSIEPIKDLQHELALLRERLMTYKRPRPSSGQPGWMSSASGNAVKPGG